MIKFILFTLLLINTNLAFSQVIRDRQASLIPQDYSIVGTAFLEELTNGDLQLRLSDDFDTPAGPDVRILLGNSLSLSGAEEIANLADIGHFNGPITFDVPSGISLDEYDFILFYCVQFQQFWASGTLGDINELGFNCEASNVSNPNGNNLIEICPSDGVDDIIEFENDLNETAGTNYVYLITDNNEILEEIVYSNTYNFEGSSENTQRIYGLHFDGDLDEKIGSDRKETAASECFTHSNDSEFLVIRKNACVECENSDVEISDSNNSISICPNDDIGDIIEFENSLNLDAGATYVYLITNSDQILQEVVFDNEYNFEGSNSEVQRVYGLNYEGNLEIIIGEDRKETKADLCFEHSNDDEFITISKDACISPIVCLESNTMSVDSFQLINICPTDGQQDSIFFTSTLTSNIDSKYAFLITDTSQILQSVVLDSVFNFEGSGIDVQRVYGINYSGELNASIGFHRFQTTATECFIHSHIDTFLTVNKLACIPEFECIETLTATTDWATEVNICPTDGNRDIIELRNSQSIELGEHYAFLITDENEILQQVTTDSTYNFEGSGLETQRVYGIHYDGVLDINIGQNRKLTTAIGCFIHSGDNLFLTVRKSNCEPEFECIETLTATTDWATEVNICPTDGNRDIIELRNSQSIELGEHYAFLITDENEILQQVTADSTYNFEGSGLETQRVYGIHYDGILNFIIGQNRKLTTASGCFIHSGDNLFLTVRKSNCEPEFECIETLTATTDWATEVNICPTDGTRDIIELRNSQSIELGEHYAFLITDENEILQQVTTDSTYNFEGSGLETQRVYGIHFDGILNFIIGQNRKSTTASGCFIHSGDNLFLTVRKSNCEPEYECVESLVATSNWVTDLGICASDGIEDNILLQNNVNVEPGSNYVFLLTDDQEILQEVIIDSFYNFEGSGDNEQRVYGLSYSGILNPRIGEPRKNTQATECYIHSGDNLFIQVNKTATCNTTSTLDNNFNQFINIYPNPSKGLIMFDYIQNDKIENITLYNINGQLIETIYDKSKIFIEQAGIYIIKIVIGQKVLSEKIIVR